MKPDDSEKQKTKGEEFANNRLLEFIASVKTNDVSAMVDMTSDLLDLVLEVAKNNERLLPFIGKVINWIKFFSEKDLNSWLGLNGRALHLLVSAVDGNRDNFSYYMFEGARLWIDKRLQPMTTVQQKHYNLVKKAIISARDDLDSHAQVFVQSVKKIRELSSGGNAGRNQEEIRAVVSELEKTMATSKLFELTNIAIDEIIGTITFLNKK